MTVSSVINLKSRRMVMPHGYLPVIPFNMYFNFILVPFFKLHLLQLTTKLL